MSWVFSETNNAYPNKQNPLDCGTVMLEIKTRDTAKYKELKPINTKLKLIRIKSGKILKYLNMFHYHTSL